MERYELLETINELLDDLADYARQDDDLPADIQKQELDLIVEVRREMAQLADEGGD